MDRPICRTVTELLSNALNALLFEVHLSKFMTSLFVVVEVNVL